MNVFTIAQNVNDILATASALLPSAEQFQVLVSQRQKQSAFDIETINKVLCYASSDDFSGTAGSANSTVQSTPTIKIMLESASKAKFTDETDPNSLTEADVLANAKMDLFISQIWNIIMDARNIDLGMAVGQVAGRYIKGFVKSDVNKKGSTIVMFASMDLTCSTPEITLGDEGVDGDNVISALNINDDTVQKTEILT